MQPYGIHAWLLLGGSGRLPGSFWGGLEDYAPWMRNPGLAKQQHC